LPHAVFRQVHSPAFDHRLVICRRQVSIGIIYLAGCDIHILEVVVGDYGWSGTGHSTGHDERRYEYPITTARRHLTVKSEYAVYIVARASQFLYLIVNFQIARANELIGEIGGFRLLGLADFRINQ
jgi:hypothetical protein